MQCVHVGVHWTTDVAAGAALGAGVALATQCWLPRRPIDEALARPWSDAPVLAEGKGLAMVVNKGSGKSGADPYDELAEVFPAARLRRLEEGEDLVEVLDEVAGESATVALGIAGGDGSVAAAARVA